MKKLKEYPYEPTKAGLVHHDHPGKAGAYLDLLQTAHLRHFAGRGLVVSWGVSIYNNSKEVLLSGNIINVFLSEEGQHYLTEDSFAAMTGKPLRSTANIFPRKILQATSKACP